MKSASIEYVMRDNYLNANMAKSKRIEDCSILLADCLVLHQQFS